MAVLYSDELQMNHFAPFFSKQTFLSYLILATTICLPFALVVPTHSKLHHPTTRFLDLLDLLLRAAQCAQSKRDCCGALYASTDLHFRLNRGTELATRFLDFCILLNLNTVNRLEQWWQEWTDLAQCKCGGSQCSRRQASPGDAVLLLRYKRLSRHRVQITSFYFTPDTIRFF